MAERDQEKSAQAPADRPADGPAEERATAAAEEHAADPADRADPADGSSDGHRLEPPDTPASIEEPDEPQVAAPPADTSRSRDRGRGRGVAYLALLVSLAAVGVVTYPNWPIQPLPIEADPSVRLLERAAQERDRLALRVETLEASSRAMVEQLSTSRAALQALNDSALERSDALLDLESRLNESVAGIVNAAPPSAREWRLAEAEYLLRVAGHRATMEHDLAGALQLLIAADEILKVLDEAQLGEVRRLLALEILNLRGAESADLTGIFLRIEALKPLIASLPLRLPQYRRDVASRSDDAEARGVLDRFLALVEFRRHDVDAVKPLLPPEQAEFVEQHLFAALDRAQLSALRRDADLYQMSIESARGWLTTYLDPADVDVVTMLDELAALAALELTFETPATGDALIRLRELRDVRLDSSSMPGESPPPRDRGVSAAEQLDAS